MAAPAPPGTGARGVLTAMFARILAALVTAFTLSYPYMAWKDVEWVVDPYLHIMEQPCGKRMGEYRARMHQAVQDILAGRGQEEAYQFFADGCAARGEDSPHCLTRDLLTLYRDAMALYREEELERRFDEMGARRKELARELRDMEEDYDEQFSNLELAELVDVDAAGVLLGKAGFLQLADHYLEYMKAGSPLHEMAYFLPCDALRRTVVERHYRVAEMLYRIRGDRVRELVMKAVRILARDTGGKT